MQAIGRKTRLTPIPNIHQVDETEETRRVQDPVIEPGIDGNHRAHREHA